MRNKLQFLHQPGDDRFFYGTGNYQIPNNDMTCFDASL